MLSPTRFHQIYRAGAQYDLWLSASFAVFTRVLLNWWLIGLISRGLGLPTRPPPDPHGIMFADFSGSVATISLLV
jgi:hypothetical protein